MVKYKVATGKYSRRKPKKRITRSQRSKRAVMGRRLRE